MKPETMQGLLRYRDARRSPGDFLKAVLENNLRETFLQADAENANDLAEIVRWCVWQLPGISWGSPEKVKDWLPPF